MGVEQALAVLRKHLPMLDSAATPTKSEVFVLCGYEAREMHDAIEALARDGAPQQQDLSSTDGEWVLVPREPTPLEIARVHTAMNLSGYESEVERAGEVCRAVRMTHSLTAAPWPAERVTACVNHPGRRAFFNLDGNDLCRPCANDWARTEGSIAP